MKRIGVYAGTFDPIHRGHLAFAREAIDASYVDGVVFLPEEMPRKKTQVTPFHHRVAMVQTAVNDEPDMSVAVASGSPFSVRCTLPELQVMLPESELAFLMGSDVALSLRHWQDVGALLGDTGLVIGLRQNDTESNIVDEFRMLSQLYAVTPRYICIKNMFNDLSSQYVREGQFAGVTDPVRKYIERHRLYG